MTNATVRLALPFILPGQAQKELFHNEALQRLDLLVQATAETAPSNIPPTAPVVGAVYIAGISATGVWLGQANAIAGWTEGGWRFVAAAEGMQLAIKSSGLMARYRSSAWQIGVAEVSSVKVGTVQVVGAQRPAIADPSGGAVVDAEGRAALTAVLAALRTHGLIST